MAEHTVANAIKAQRERSKQLKLDNDRKYAKLVQQSSAAGQAVVDDVNGHLGAVVQSQTQIEAATKTLCAESEHFHRQLQEYAVLLGKFNHALKELGDVENWGRVLEEDVAEVLQVMEAVAAAKRKANSAAPR